MAAGLTCVVTGVVAMLSRKQRGRHPLAGTIYYWAHVIVQEAGAGQIEVAAIDPRARWSAWGTRH
jgi:hypothetical protein